METNNENANCAYSDQSPDKLNPKTCPVDEIATEFDPFDAPFQNDPAQSLIWAREQKPAFFAPKIGYWIISRYDDVKAVFRDNILYSPSIVLEKIIPFSDSAMNILKSYDYQLNRTLVNEDEPVHTERRRALMEHFIPENLKVRESMIRELTTKYIDQFIDKGEVDLVDEMLWEIPLSVALNFLGVPQEDVETLKEYCTAHMVNTWGKPTPQEQESVAHAVGKFWQYSGKVLAKMRTEENGTGWMHYAIRKQKELPDVITDSYLHSMMMAIIVAAHETTSHGTANALRMLLNDQEAWQNIIDDHGLIPNAVEECLRISGSVVAWRRMATRDTEISGVKIPKDAKLLIVSASANHDERQFENPEILDLYRDNAVDHLTFGYGSHQCMGKNLARMEMRIFIEEFAYRLPHMRLVEDQEFTYLPNISFRGPNKLLVRWDPSLNPERNKCMPKAERTSFAIGPPIKADIARKIVVSDIRHDGENTKVFTLTDPSRRSLPRWSAGAHVDLLFDEFDRKYSLCGETENCDYLQIAVLLEPDGGGGSRYLHEKISIGDTVKIRGPKNHFRLSDNDRHKILIAGGIGITPIIAMADYLKTIGCSYEIHYCCKSDSHMVFKDRLSSQHGNQAHIYFSQTGNRLDLGNLIKNAAHETQFYACGPDRMLEEIQELTDNLPDGSLKFEHFSTGVNELDSGSGQEFSIHLEDSGIDLIVPDNQTLLQVLQSQGIDLPYDCLEGLCGSCEVTVQDGQIEHRDKVLSKNEKRRNNKMMACCSRANNGQKLTIAL